MRNKLNNLPRNSKPSWSLLKCFLNYKKIPLIPPLFYENEFVTNFLEKAKLFSSFFFSELGLESFQSRRWYRKLPMFYKIYKNKSHFYLFNLIPEKKSSYATRNVDFIFLIKTKHNFFKNTFFPSAIIEWNELDPTI